MRALMMGLRVQHKYETYTFREQKFGILGWARNEGQPDHEVFMRVDWSVTHFIDWCQNEFTERQITEIAADIAFNESKRRNRWR